MRKMALRKSMAFVCATSMLCASMSGSTYAAGLESTASTLINDNLTGINIQITDVDEGDETSNDNPSGQTTTSKGTVSCNVQTNGYDGSYHASPIRFYLYENNGFLYRLEYTGGKVILEKYSSELKYLGKGEIEPELPIFGGFFSGSDYNFIIYGDNNLSENNKKEVVRVVKYTKGMKRVSSTSYYGCNTYIPFDAGCPRMDEYNGVLYIHASHEMYESSDGYHHQANMDFYIDISDMTTVYSRYGVSSPSTGYISYYQVKRAAELLCYIYENHIYSVDDM